MARQLFDSHFTAELFVLISVLIQIRDLGLGWKILLMFKNKTKQKHFKHPQKLGERNETELASSLQNMTLVLNLS